MNDFADLIFAHVETWRPRETITPSEFAEKYRVLKEGTTERPGRWSNDVFPYLSSIMDAIKEALDTGKRGVVLMKSGQGGGSEAMINCVAWLLYMYPGPILYLISTDQVAKSFEKDRIKFLIRTCEPLRRKALLGKYAGETIHEKRFTDGKLAIYGGKSVSKVQSIPYRFAFVDEVDSLKNEMGREGIEGDPIDLVKIRTNAYKGETLVVAFAHPTTKDRGAGKLYYELSDQRRAHIECPHCGELFWLRWELVIATPNPGETQKKADANPARYQMFSPCCGAELTDAQRYAACRKQPRQISVLAEDVAEEKSWIGVHFSQIYDTIPLRRIAEDWCAARGNMAQERVFKNKRLGDVFEARLLSIDEDAWRALVTLPRSPDDNTAYRLGQLPDGVEFLTCGQDSRSTELHWAVWGWGRVEASDGEEMFCGWLIDCGIVEREKSLTLAASDLAPLDAHIYRRSYGTTDSYLMVTQGLHDSGWQPIAVYEYCRRRRGKAFPCRGAAVDDRSPAPPIRWSHVPPYMLGGTTIKDPAARLAMLNTFQLKTELFGMVERRFETADGDQATVLRLPTDTSDRFITECSNETLVEERGSRRWKERGPNHFLDCTVYALAAALNLGALSVKRKTATATTSQSDYGSAGESRGKSTSGWRIGR